MQIKAADDKQPEIAMLEALLAGPAVAPSVQRQIEDELRAIRAGIKGERDAAYQIELYFGRSENWATIHDLRIEVDGRAAQIDHLILNRLAEVWVCESKSFAEGVSINEYGEWSRWWHGRPHGMESPIEQNRRHIHLLQRAFDQGLAALPRRLGLAAMRPRLRSLVLVSNTARITRPRQKVEGLDEVIKAEQLKTRLFDEFENRPALDLARVIGKEGLEQFARGLAALHRPANVDWAARFGLSGDIATQGSASPVPQRAIERGRTQRAQPWRVKYDGQCSSCGRSLPKGSAAVWDNARRKMYCLDCRPPHSEEAPPPTAQT